MISLREGKTNTSIYLFITSKHYKMHDIFIKVTFLKRDKKQVYVLLGGNIVLIQIV